MGIEFVVCLILMLMGIFIMGVGIGILLYDMKMRK